MSKTTDMSDEEPMVAEQAAEPITPTRQTATEPKQHKPGVSGMPPGAGVSLLAQTLPISIPRNLRVDVQVRGDELKKEDLAKIKSQITRWLEGLDEAFE